MFMALVAQEITNLQYVRVANEKASEREICFKVRIQDLPWDCLKYHQSFETRAVIQQIMISPDSAIGTVDWYKNGISCQENKS
jgi:hypothetical protein